MASLLDKPPRSGQTISFEEALAAAKSVITYGRDVGFWIMRDPEAKNHRAVFFEEEDERDPPTRLCSGMTEVAARYVAYKGGWLREDV